MRFIDPDGGDSRFGHSFGPGDLDGDGWLDVAIGASERHKTIASLLTGFVSLFAGPLSGELSRTDADTTIEGPDGSFALFGGGLSAGDLLFEIPTGC